MIAHRAAVGIAPLGRLVPAVGATLRVGASPPPRRRRAPPTPGACRLALMEVRLAPAARDVGILSALLIG